MPLVASARNEKAGKARRWILGITRAEGLSAQFVLKTTRRPPGHRSCKSRGDQRTDREGKLNGKTQTMSAGPILSRLQVSLMSSLFIPRLVGGRFRSHKEILLTLCLFLDMFLRYFPHVSDSLAKSVPTLCKTASTISAGKGHISVAFLARQSIFLT